MGLHACARAHDTTSNVRGAGFIIYSFTPLAKHARQFYAKPREYMPFHSSIPPRRPYPRGYLCDHAVCEAHAVILLAERRRHVHNASARVVRDVPVSAHLLIFSAARGVKSAVAAKKKTGRQKSRAERRRGVATQQRVNPQRARTRSAGRGLSRGVGGFDTRSHWLGPDN